MGNVVARQSGAWGEEAKTDENDRICLRIADFDYDNLRFKKNIKYTIRNYNNVVIERTLLENGDILIEKSGGGEKTPVGRAVLFDMEIEALFANFMDRLRVLGNHSPNYITYFFHYFYVSNLIWLYIKQTTGLQNLDLDGLLHNEYFFLPPLSEQREIVSYLDAKVSEINKLIKVYEDEIENVKKYKNSLVSAVVTGQIAV